jgi:type IX secretion system PorP/SprF family membrane protein
MKKGLLFTLFFTLALTSKAQNVYRYSQFNFLKSMYNPAALASDARLSADMVYRNQWVGLAGAPTTIGLNVATELTSNMALGVNFCSDKIGLNQSTSVSAMYSYRIVFADRQYLSLGLGLGADNVIQDLAAASTTMPNDPAYSQSYNMWKLNASFGAYYRSSKGYVGLSVPQLFQQTPSGPESGFTIPRWHYMLIGGYYFELGDKAYFNPNVQIKYTKNAPIQGDFLLRGVVGSVGVSLGYRTENALIAGADFMIAGKFRVGYSFNYGLGSLSRVKGASHEVHLGFGLPYYFSSDSFGGQKFLGRKGKFRRNYQLRYNRSNNLYRVKSRS